MGNFFRPSCCRCVSLIGLAALLAACAVNPVTGKKELSLVSPGQEVALGQHNYEPSQQSQGGLYSIDPALQRYVAEVGAKLAAVSDRPGLPYEFVVLNNSVPNAWALPGGKIAINRGLLVKLEDEAQLAAVLGHEIVHAAARHGASQMTRGMLLGTGAQVAAIISQSAGYGDLVGQAAQIGSAAWMARYGRDDELESDAYGMTYMSRAGYDPTAAVELQQLFVELSKDRQSDFISGLFASHPPSAERVAANRTRAASLPRGERYKQRFQTALAQLRRDQPAYDAAERAQKALADNKPQDALAALDIAVKKQPAESQFWGLRGQAWQQLKELDKAEQAYTTAINKNPSYFRHHLARGLLRFEQNQHAAARIDLNTSQTLLPTPLASYYLGEMAKLSGDSAAALAYFREVGAQGELGAKAQREIAAIEIREQPARYIKTALTLDNQGSVYLLVQNASPLQVQNLSFVLSDGQGSGSERVQIGYTLKPGEQTQIKTGLRSAADGLGQWRVRVESLDAD